MADTIVTNTPATSDNSAAGWIVALVIIIAVIVGGIYFYRHGIFGAATPASTTNINVTVPNPTTPTAVTN